MASAVSSTGRPRTRRRATIIVGLAVLVVVVVSAGMLLNHILTPVRTIQNQRFPGQPMRDALGLFTATTPPGWTVTGTEYPNGECIDTVCFNSERYVFQDHQPWDTVTIQARAFNSSDMPYCPSYLGIGGGYTKTTVDGLPAGSTGNELVFNSGNAFFEIDTNIPTRSEPAIINSIHVTNRGIC